MTPEAGWYPVALADDIEPGTSSGTRLFGQELVVWRDEAGRCHVWEDRCPHRGMRLSFGFVRGSHIACLYHGWQFDAAGRCRSIPAHPKLDVPATITVGRFASAERLGLIWVGWGEGVAGTAPPGEDAETLPVRSLAILAPACRVVAALASGGSPFGDDPAVAVAGSRPLMTLRSGTEQVHLAIQPVAAGETTVHIVVPSHPAGSRQRISLWAEALRRRVEGAALKVGAVG